MQHDQLASPKSLAATTKSLTALGYDVKVVADGSAALKEIIATIPKGASVMNGASVTLKEIGFVDYLKSDQHGWHNLHEAIVKEEDPVKKAALRAQSISSDYYLGSVHALMEDGEYLVASNTGSQLPHIVFTSPNLIFVVSTKKIVRDLTEALERLQEHVIPHEDDRMQEEYGMGTKLTKLFISKGESQMMGRKVTFILVKEKLGF